MSFAKKDKLIQILEMFGDPDLTKELEDLEEKHHALLRNKNAFLTQTLYDLTNQHPYLMNEKSTESNILKEFCLTEVGPMQPTPAPKPSNAKRRG